MTGPARDFTCELCGGSFHTHVPIEEVVTEAEGIFGPMPEDDSAVASVCDGCYQQLMALMVAEGLPQRWEE
jgi:hypothetical protein